MSANLTESLEPPKVGATLQNLRQAQGLSLDELSRRAGVSKSMLSQIERNQANPTVAVVWRLANALGVEMTELLGAERIIHVGHHGDRLAIGEQCGATHLVNGKEQDVVEAVMEITGGEGADGVAETISGNTTITQAID